MKQKQIAALRVLRDSVMTPDRFSRNGLAYDTRVPGTVLDQLLSILADYEKDKAP